MELHEEYVFNRRTVLRVPGGWIYENENYKNETAGEVTSCFVPEPSSQTTTPTNNRCDGCLATVELEPPEPDYDKTAQAEKDFLTMGSFN